MSHQTADNGDQLNNTTAVDDIDWNSLGTLKRNDLQRLCKEFKLPIKATSKNVDIIEALKLFKKEYDEKHQQQQQELQQQKEKERQAELQKQRSIIGDSSSSSSSSSETTKQKDKSDTRHQDDVNNNNQVNDDTIRGDDASRDTAGDDYTGGDNEPMREDYDDDNAAPTSTDNDGTKGVIDEQFKESLPIPEEDTNTDDQVTIKRAPVFRKRSEPEHLDTEENGDADHDHDGVPAAANARHAKAVEETVHVGLKFRNYAPREATLVKYRLPKSKVPPVVEEIMAKLQLLESGAANLQDDSISFMPRKANWDLKRDVEKKLNKLEKRTNRAIYELIKKKLESEGDQSMDLLSRAVDRSTYK